MTHAASMASGDDELSLRNDVWRAVRPGVSGHGALPTRSSWSRSPRTTWRTWAALATHYSEQRFVDPMPITFMEALFPEEFEGVAAVPWMRGVVADGDPVAFVMTSETHGHQEGHYLWRMLVDRKHQRRGIGRRALVLLFDHLREHGVSRLFTSCGQGVGTPKPFYESLGFRATGRLLDDEVELVVAL